MLTLYQPALVERHQLDPTTPSYQLVLKENADRADWVMVKHSSSHTISFIDQLLIENNERRILVFTSIGNIHVSNALKELSLQYPLAVVDIAYQPIQPARIWEFLDKAETKQIHYEWEEGDWDEF